MSTRHYGKSDFALLTRKTERESELKPQKKKGSYMDTNNNNNNDNDAAYQNWKAAEKAQQEIVAQKQVDLLKARLQLERIRGEEDLEKSLATIAEAFPDGIAFPMVKSAFEPTANLTKAKDSLVKNGVITVDDKKRGMTVKPVKKESAQTMEEAAK